MRRKRKAFLRVWFLILIVGVHSSCERSKEYTPYGRGDYIYSAEIDAWTEEIKEQQRKNGAEFLEQLATVIQNGGNELTLEKKHYRFNEEGDRGPFIDLSGVEDLTINGNGAEFWFENYKTALSMVNCKNITFRGLSFDWDPLPFSQVIVTKVDSVSIEGETEPGFRNMTDILNDPSVRGRPDLKLFVFDSKTGLLLPDVAHSHLDSIKVTGKNRLKFYGVGFSNYKYNEQNINPGDRMAVVMRQSTSIRIRKSEAIKFVDFNLYSSPMFGISMGDGGGGLVLQNFRLTPRPGTKRSMSSNGDGVHLTSLKRGPLIEECEFSATGDDAMNIHGDFGMVQEQLEENKIIVAVKNFSNIQVGSTINLYDEQSLAYKGEFKIINIEETSDDLLLDAKRIGREKSIKFWPGNGSIICELDKPVKVNRYDIVESMDDIGSGTVIRNNFLHNLTTRGFLLQTKDALVEYNKFIHIDNAAIAVMASLEWCEAPFPENITIKNNIIRNVNIGLGSRYSSHSKIGAISVNIEYPGQLKQNARPIGGVIIENNEIYDSATAGIVMLHTQNSSIGQNLIDGYCIFPQLEIGRSKGIEPYAGIYIGDSENVRIQNNRMVNGGEYAKEHLKIGKYVDEGSIHIVD